MDEPLSALDRQKTGDLALSGNSYTANCRSLLFMPSRYYEVSRLADHLTLLQQGK